ncbi:MAG: RecX family transcriptional regulator [Ekhidna sp.]|nr:RecX family transcriptional regulator [Ekhidna sp.]MBC6409999.1 RecX family transcriptional regulator [Ekhidna sp.]MBC6426931.1 RecX family transcriptional regulator [Ekhidna sp.]
MARQLSIKEAKQRAGKFCALRERSPQEVYDKVRSWGLSERECQEIVDLLVRGDFVNEQRFANAYCRDKFEFNSWGRQKIKSGILPYKISSAILEESLSKIDPKKYKLRLYKLAKKKWEYLHKEEDQKKKQKTASYLVSKGFEPDLIWSTINSLSEKSH